MIDAIYKGYISVLAAIDDLIEVLKESRPSHEKCRSK